MELQLEEQAIQQHLRDDIHQQSNSTISFPIFSLVTGLIGQLTPS